MSRFNAGLVVFLLGFVLAGCERGPTSAAGIRLPDGNADAGRAAFADLYCYDCHAVTNEVFPDSVYPDNPGVVLGGDRSRVTTYGELVTSIINPSHKLARGYDPDTISADGESLMRDYNDSMTVQQLIDLVVFLQPHYDVIIPPYAYPTYH